MALVAHTLAGDDRVAKVLARSLELADISMAGIDDAALEIAGLAEGDVAVIAAVRRRLAAQMAERPDRRTRQAVSLVRRALEIGAWDWAGYEEGNQ
jgi:hypothetical protein